ncbi:GNAT family N-acetyltransferase [Simiduia curdlanivorans]|uniref:GNAT family N-acetyltransferase n=1 Tax=Simiduia curdlanivorans TaxID=1492769 RepID=A0ABV8V5Y7_9GAMM|nr:GNAT family N-acetyltransferase [Simiduia curdlanivorans]MDN3640822.1 GNAT family N-acetyltransferase [Simiduia curdlanivorans]
MDIATLPNVSVRPLRQAPEFAQSLAHWLHLERQRFGAAGTEVEGLGKLQAECTGTSDLPHTNIAVRNNELLGAVTLMRFDGPLARPGDVWLSNLWVDPQWRNKGLGRLLCHSVIELARDQQFSTIQLFTYDKSPFYQAMGWAPVRRAKIAGRSCTIMAFAL